MGMRFDIENQLSVAQVFPGAATVSTNSYKKATAAQDLSIGRRVAALFLPSTTPGAPITVEVIQADDAALTVNVTSLSTVVFPASKVIPGAALEVPVPQGVMNQMYLGARVTGTVTADIYLVPQDEDAQYATFPNVTPIGV